MVDEFNQVTANSKMWLWITIGIIIIILIVGGFFMFKSKNSDQSWDKTNPSIIKCQERINNEVRISNNEGITGGGKFEVNPQEIKTFDNAQNALDYLESKGYYKSGSDFHPLIDVVGSNVEINPDKDIVVVIAQLRIKDQPDSSKD